MGTMKFTTEVGEYAFNEKRLPLLTRRIATTRATEQSGGMRKVDCTLQGYFTGETHDVLKLRYDEMLAHLAVNQATFTYNDGTRDILDLPVYIDNITDDNGWKQFILNFTISFYYYAQVSHAADQVTASYESEAGSYSFAVTPAWEFLDTPNRRDPQSPLTLPSGVQLGSNIQIQLNGRVCANTAVELTTQREALRLAFSKDGQLNYGSFSAPVHVGPIRMPSHTPQNYFDYSIDLNYFAPGLVDFSAKRKKSRMHNNPIVRENPGCSSGSYVISRFSTGQYIDYSISAKGSSISDIRTRLSTELAALVISGGTEMPGGFEDESLYPPSIDAQFTVYYATEVLPNL